MAAAESVLLAGAPAAGEPLAMEACRAAGRALLPALLAPPPHPSTAAPPPSAAAAALAQHLVQWAPAPLPGELADRGTRAALEAAGAALVRAALHGRPVAAGLEALRAQAAAAVRFGAGGGAAALEGAPPPRPPPRTKWTHRVPHPVPIGHAASLTSY